MNSKNQIFKILKITLNKNLFLNRLICKCFSSQLIIYVTDDFLYCVLLMLSSSITEIFIDYYKIYLILPNH